MKTLAEIMARVQRLGHPVHKGRLIVNPLNGELARQAESHGLSTGMSTIVPPGKALFFPAAPARVISPEERRELIHEGNWHEEVT